MITEATKIVEGIGEELGEEAEPEAVENIIDAIFINVNNSKRTLCSKFYGSDWVNY